MYLRNVCHPGQHRSGTRRYITRSIDNGCISGRQRNLGGHALVYLSASKRRLRQPSHVPLGLPPWVSSREVRTLDVRLALPAPISRYRRIFRSFPLGPVVCGASRLVFAGFPFCHLTMLGSADTGGLFFLPKQKPQSQSRSTADGSPSSIGQKQRPDAASGRRRERGPAAAGKEASGKERQARAVPHCPWTHANHGRSDSTLVGLSVRGSSPPRRMHPHVLGWRWPGLSVTINWQRDTPTHQDGSHFEPHLDSRPSASDEPFPPIRLAFPRFPLLRLYQGILPSPPRCPLPSPQ